MKTPLPQISNGFAFRDKAFRSSGVGSLAKITMPLIRKCFLRERVFQHLDELTECPLIWLSAPAGYGKTTVVSSYLDVRERPTVWYQCDQGDDDIASFFLYMALARSEVSSDTSLPAFQSQYLAAIPTFTRNFFRNWFARLPTGATLVLDNWQDVPANGALRDMLPIIAEQIPQGMAIIVISRDEPPVSLARLSTNGRMAVIEVEQLQLSISETAAMVKLHAAFPERIASVEVDQLHAATRGWAAGVTLMLRSERAMPLPGTELQGPLQGIFDYLATEVFERLEDSVQQFLLKTSCLEHIAVPIARQLSGNDDSAKILDGLTRQNAFTLYRPASSSYYYHPLFREFLRARLSASLGPIARRAWLVDAGQALAGQGDAEAAIRLFIQAESWEDAAALIRTAAVVLMQRARLGILLGWIEALPRQVLIADSWLMYWRGMCQLVTAFVSARKTLDDAYTLFARENDRVGQMLACAGILQHITYCYADYRTMLPWIEALELNLEGAPFPSPRVELQIMSAFMLALSQAMPRHPKLSSSVARVSELVEAESDLTSRAEGVSALLHFFSRFGRTAHYGDMDIKVAQLLADRSLPPVHRLNLMWLQAYQLHSGGDPERVAGILRDARALARHEGLHSEDTRMRVCELQAQEIGPSTTAALATFSELEPYLRLMPCIPLAHFLYVRAMFELACGHSAEALAYIEEAVPMIRASHWYIGEALSLTGMAEIYCSLDRYDDAASCIQTCCAIIADVEAPLVEFNTRLVQAEIARLTKNDEAFATELARAFAIGRQQGYANGFHTSSQLLRRLLPYAVQLQIERSYCRWVISKRRFKPPSAASIHWPWAVRIRALGRLEIVVDDAPLAFTGKTQRKPLDLLKLLVAHGNGMEAVRLMDLLWPELEADSARNALDLALHRLRKILKMKDAVVLVDGSVLLNRDTVWTDTFALEHFNAKEVTSVELPNAVEHLLDIYRAPLLYAEEGVTSIAHARNLLRSKFVRITSGFVERLASSEQWELLIALCGRAIEREPTEERLHRDLIRGLVAQGHHAQAKLAYQHCEQILAQRLATTPSFATRSVLHSAPS